MDSWGPKFVLQGRRMGAPTATAPWTDAVGCRLFLGACCPQHLFHWNMTPESPQQVLTLPRLSLNTCVVSAPRASHLRPSSGCPWDAQLSLLRGWALPPPLLPHHYSPQAWRCTPCAGTPFPYSQLLSPPLLHKAS